MTTQEIVDVLGRTSRVGDVEGRTRRVSDVRGRTARVSDVLGETGVDLGGGPPVDPPDPGDPQDTAIMWLTADQGVTGTGDEVDTWATRSDSGLTLTEAGSGKPLVLGRRIGLDNADVQQNFFTVGDTSTFEAVNTTGVFTFAWRGTIDALDGLDASVNGMIIVTKSNGRGCFLAYNDTLMNFTVTDAGNNILYRLLDNDWASEVAFGTPHDYLVQGDGTTVRMYRNGVEVDSTPFVAQAGAHQFTAKVGTSANEQAYLIGSIEGLFFDDAGPDTYTVAEARALVAVARTFEATDHGSVIWRYSSTDGAYPPGLVSRLTDAQDGALTFTAPTGSSEGTHVVGPPPYLRLDGADDYYKADGTTTPWDVMHTTTAGGGAGGCTIAQLVRFVASPSEALMCLWATKGFSGGNGLGLWIQTSFGAHGRLRIAAGSDGITNSATHDLTAALGTDWHTIILDVDADADTWTPYVDGVALGGPQSFTQVDGASTYVPVLWADPREVGRYELDGDASEVIAYSGAMGAAGIAALHTDLMELVA